VTTDELVGKLIELGGRLHVGDMELIAEAVSRIRDADRPLLPLRARDWAFHYGATADGLPGDWWLIGVSSGRPVWAKTKHRAEMETLSGEK
jgi:hypothetical protein